MITILFVNNSGGGFADRIGLSEGTTIGQLFATQMPESRPEHYMIRANGAVVDSGYTIVDGDRVTFTPTKLDVA